MAKSARIAVIGAGLGGLCAAIKLKQAGYENVRLFERAAEVGGTWRENTYPGCSCDTPVALYQFSFAPSAAWKNTFPSSAEVKPMPKSSATASACVPICIWARSPFPPHGTKQSAIGS